MRRSISFALAALTLIVATELGLIWWTDGWKLKTQGSPVRQLVGLNSTEKIFIQVYYNDTLTRTREYLAFSRRNMTDVRVIENLFNTTTNCRSCSVLLKKYHSYSKYNKSIIYGLQADDLVSSDKKFLKRLIQNCTKTYEDFSKRLYVPEFERNFPIAFEMLTYYEPLRIQQYIKLLRNIYRPQNTYCIHIDTSHSPKWWIELFHSFASCFPNVLMAKNPIAVKYATSDILNAHLRCFGTLLDSNSEWKYVISLHGTEIPLITNRQIVIQLKRMNGSNIITRGMNDTAIDPSVEKFKWIDLIFSHIKNNGTHVESYSVYKSASSANSAISQPMAQYMLTDKKALELIGLLKTAKSAVEFFFSTVNHFWDAPGGSHTLSSHFKMPVIAQRDWFDGGNSSEGFCEAGFHRHGICIVSAYDLPRLYIASTRSQYWFHNKYFIEYDHTVMDCIEQVLLKRNKEEYYYDSLLTISGGGGHMCHDNHNSLDNKIIIIIVTIIFL